MKIKAVLFAAFAAALTFAHIAPAAAGSLIVNRCGGESLTAGQIDPFDSETAKGSKCIDPVVPVTSTDKGGTIATGGTAQTAIAANTSRRGCWVQNPANATEDLYVSSSGSATTAAGTPDDADLPPGASWSCTTPAGVIQSAISIVAATTSHAFIAKETQ